MRDAALALAARGFRVFPIKPGAKFPPLIKDWPARSTSVAGDIETYWMPVPNANVGIHCDGLCVIDVDTKKGGDDALAYLEMAEDLPVTLTARTPTGGRHLFYRLPDGHAGVPNSVEVLGKGLDIRSTGGYVVGAGSKVVAGTYTFIDDTAEIAPAPEWLIDRLGTFTARDHGPVVQVADASPEVLERAEAWLRTAERSVKGAGGDQAAYRVACRLRDMGVSYQQACELMRSEAWEFGCGWRDMRLEDKPIRSAYRYATGTAGSKAALPDDFPVEESTVEAPPAKRSRLLRLKDFVDAGDTSRGYVVKGLFHRHSYAEAFGAPGEGKTFVMLDVAYHVAADAAWMGRKVRGGPALYLAFEGTGGLVKRAQALRRKYGDKDVPLFICAATMNLREQAGRQDLGAVMAGLPAKPAMIVIDTFARALMGGDENSAQDVGAFNNAVAALIESTGACVVIIHHTGKDASKGARGSSALLGAIDTEVRISEGNVTATKQRDVEAGEPIGFKLTPMIVGIDEDQEDVTSCVIEPAQAGTSTANLPRLTGNSRSGFQVLCDARPDNAPISAVEWREACKEFLGERNIAQRFFDIKNGLMKKGYITVDEEGLITRKMT